mgnify:CR=1 FL=1
MKPRPREAKSRVEMAASRDELGICAQVSLRYELPYLLSWVGYHTLLDFDRITLYLDDLKHLDQVDQVEGRKHMLQVLGRARHVTVLRMSAHNMSGPADQLTHCVWAARKRAVWMAMWDIDEVPALGPPPSALPTADEHRVPPSLKALLRALPNRTAGLLVPRLQFDCNGHETPAQPPLLEYEAFTRRSCAPDGGGKVLSLTRTLAPTLTLDSTLSLALSLALALTLTLTRCSGAATPRARERACDLTASTPLLRTDALR